MIFSRREFFRTSASGAASLAAATSVSSLISAPAFAAATNDVAGVNPTNDPATLVKFSQYLGRRANYVNLFFNQNSPSDFIASIDWIINQGRQFLALGTNVIWSVPCPGARQLEAIADGVFDAHYLHIFKGILSLYPVNNSQILVRLPWEFNLAGQTNAAIDKNGTWNGPVFIKAFQHLSTMAKQVSPRFQRIWCPNVTTQNIDPVRCWPGSAYFEIVAQDFYMDSRWNKAGDFNWFLNEQRGLLWGANSARIYKKAYALTEWGMNSDIFVKDFNLAALWLKGLGERAPGVPLLSHHCWWDRQEDKDCRISTAGIHPGLAAAFKAQFA